MKNTMLRLLCVLSAHYRLYGPGGNSVPYSSRQFKMATFLLRFVRWWAQVPEAERVPATLWPPWAHGVVAVCPDCSQRFLLELDVDSPCCARCRTDRRYPQNYSTAHDGAIEIHVL